MMQAISSMKIVLSLFRRNARFIVVALFLVISLKFLAFNSDEGLPNVAVIQSTYDWSQHEFYHPIPTPFAELPAVSTRSLPKIQHDFKRPSRAERKTTQARKELVREVFLKSWNSYKDHAWMRDELKPLSAGWVNTFGGWAATLIDALDTLWIMGLKKEFGDAVVAVASLDWSETKTTSCNLFETTIRHLGGLLSAYELSKHPVLLAKAVELGDMLYVSFDTPNNLPPFWFDYELGKQGKLVAEDHEPSTTPGTLAMEFTKLAQLTGDKKYYNPVHRIETLLHDSQNATRIPGLWPTHFNLREGDGNFTQDTSFTLGALADSLYEYIPKMYLLLNSAEPMYKDMYLSMAEPIIKHLLFRPMTPNNEDILFPGSVHVSYIDTEDERITLNPEMQHLACFTGGLFALGGKLFSTPEHVDIGARLTKGCIWAYEQFPHGIAPEIFRLIPCPSLDGKNCKYDPSLFGSNTAIPTTTSTSHQKRMHTHTHDHEHEHTALSDSNPVPFPNLINDKQFDTYTSHRDHNAEQNPLSHSPQRVYPPGIASVSDARYILRPEAIESVFVLYRTTGDSYYRDAAWEMFTSIIRATETDYANAAVSDVTVEGELELKDSMESFWLAETLKYFYLIWEKETVVDLGEWVLNTEAHPLRIIGR